METSATKPTPSTEIVPLHPMTTSPPDPHPAVTFQTPHPSPNPRVFAVVFVAGWAVMVVAATCEYALGNLPLEACQTHLIVLGVLVAVSTVLWVAGYLVTRSDHVLYPALFLWASVCYSIQDERFSTRVTAETYSGSMTSGVLPLLLLYQQLHHRSLVNLAYGLLSVFIVGAFQAAGERPISGLSETVLYLFCVLYSSRQNLRTPKHRSLTGTKDDFADWGITEDVVNTDFDSLLKKLKSHYTHLSSTASLCTGKVHDQLKRAMITALDLARDLNSICSRSECTTAGLVSKAADSEYRQLLEDRFRPDNSASRKPIPRAILYGTEKLRPMLAQIEKNWNFDTFFLAEISGQKPLEVTGEYCIRKYGLMPGLKLDEGKVLRFLQELERKYHDNPYHNSTHAADVLNSLLFLYHQSAIFKDTTELELFGSIIAALGHDVGHPAFNNRYLANSKSHLCMICNW